MHDIQIHTSTQQLFLYERGMCIATYEVSSAQKGLGERKGSEQTPRGKHIVRAKIGEGCPMYTVFRGRRPTGQLYSPALSHYFPQQDWILTRILWLSGVEVGKNRLHEVDTMQRYIYIHGAPESVFTGKPLSKGCIRMKNKDILELFEQIDVRTSVIIF